jgi:hypothetical protein
MCVPQRFTADVRSVRPSVACQIIVLLITESDVVNIHKWKNFYLNLMFAGEQEVDDEEEEAGELKK